MAGPTVTANGDRLVPRCFGYGDPAVWSWNLVVRPELVRCAADAPSMA